MPESDGGPVFFETRCL